MLNTVTIEGRLTRDPEIKQTASNITLANFSLANERGFGDKQKTNFFEVTVWGNLAERIEKAKVAKGSHIYLVGNLDQQKYEKDGVTHYRIKINVSDSGGEWGYISSGQKKQDKSSAADEDIPDDPGFSSDDDDLPF